MSFLLGECRELNFNELVEINGGGLKTFIGKVSTAIKNTGKQENGAETTSSTSNGGNSTTVTTTSNGCSGKCSGSSVTVTNGGTANPLYNNDNKKTLVISTTNNCSGAYISYHSQLLFNDDNMKGGTKFGKTACGVSSIANEISEQYTKETGKSLSEAQLISAVQKAVDAGKISATDAFVKDWGGAAQAISDALGLKGTWTYTDNASDATAVIISIDTNGSDKNFDGYHDHFVNDIGNGQYYDPYTNKIGNISDLHLTSKWNADDGIKSAYRYIQYTTTKN